jgi:CheY-like chemotaxis protein
MIFASAARSTPTRGRVAWRTGRYRGISLNRGKRTHSGEPFPERGAGEMGTGFAKSADMHHPPPPNLKPVPPEGSPSADEAQRRAVLIVEDERVARRALATLLAAHGFDIASAESAEEALRLLQDLQSRAEQRVALVDLNLPGMSGIDFIDRLERMDPSVYPVLMTAASDDVLDEAIRDRPVTYLRKPLDLGQLLTVITHGEERH